jgi:hypothetical protein
MFTLDQELLILNMNGDYNCPAKFKKYLPDDYAYVMVEHVMLKIKVSRLVDRLEWNKSNPIQGPTYVLGIMKGSKDNE